jgi:hypothetical protein
MLSCTGELLLAITSPKAVDKHPESSARDESGILQGISNVGPDMFSTMRR